MLFNKKNKKQQKIELGTLYDINKNIVEKTIKSLTKEEMQNKKELIINYIKNTNNQYYMLLCNDKKDYTIFRRKQNGNNDFLDLIENSECEKLWDILINECLPNRGETKSIELTESQDAIEIWISVDKESYCYYLFPYDNAIIEC